MKSFFDWFGVKEFKEPPEFVARDIEARLPSEAPGTGKLDPRSPTWAYVHTWAVEAMYKAREKNDNVNRDLIQTSVLRGEIKVLKELINLPNPKSMKGLLED